MNPARRDAKGEVGSYRPVPENPDAGFLHLHAAEQFGLIPEIGNRREMSNRRFRTKTIPKPLSVALLNTA